MTVVKSTVTPALPLDRPDRAGSLYSEPASCDWRGFWKRFDRQPGFTCGIGPRRRASIVKRHGLRFFSHLSFDSGKVRDVIQGRGYLTQEAQAVYT